MDLYLLKSYTVVIIGCVYHIKVMFYYVVNIYYIDYRVIFKDSLSL